MPEKKIELWLGLIFIVFEIIESGNKQLSLCLTSNLPSKHFLVSNTPQPLNAFKWYG